MSANAKLRLSSPVNAGDPVPGYYPFNQGRWLLDARLRGHDGCGVAPHSEQRSYFAAAAFSANAFAST
jgi:hypothetical protein